MMTADDPGAKPPADDLQFEHADFNADPAPLGCGGCGRPIADAYYEINTKVLCGDCRDDLLGRFTGGSGLARFVRAGLFGTLAALAGTSLYFLVLALTGYEVALIAIAVGLMVGTAVRRGSRYRGGWPYQALAVFLTYTAIVSSYVPTAFIELRKQLGEEPAAAGNPARPAQDPKAPAALAKPAQAEPLIPPAGGPKRTLGIGLSVVLLVILMIYAYALPFLGGVQNIIGLLIIFFGLQQAWRLNRKAQLAISGPFLVNGEGPPPLEAAAHA